MLLRLLFAGGIQEFAHGLAEAISQSYPAAIANSPEPLVSQQRRTEILENIFSSAGQFSIDNRLGFLGRILLQRTLRWQLRVIGYDETFINTALEYLAVSFTSPRR